RVGRADVRKWMESKMRTSVLCGLVLVQALGGALLGCGSGEGGANSDVGSVSEVNLGLTALPSGVQCLQVAITSSGGATLASQTFTASANWTATVGLGSFTKGTVSVGANAYNVACTAIAGATPTWTADAASAEVTPGRPNPVTLNFRQNLGVNASANFAPTVVDLALGDYSTGLVFADGTVKVVGFIAQPTGLSSVAELAVGYSHACARKNDGTVWCWGSNDFGELGNGTTTASATTPVRVTGITGATHIAAGNGNTCAMVAPNNDLMCWGGDYLGSFMDGLNDSRLTPLSVAGNQVTQMALGGGNLCLINKYSLGVICGGENRNGELGSGTTTASPYGAAAGVLPAKAITIGLQHACAVDPTGNVRCWGNNSGGQLGLNNQTDSSVPVQVSSLTGVEEIGATGAGTCARTAAGSVYCWGGNLDGEVGDGTNTRRLSPVLVLTGSKKLRAGANHVCSLQADSSIKCWGFNGYGELLDGTSTTSVLPIPAKL
ncbi:MAG: hypothetical protein ABJB12_13330, partial [Pseudomonadota bacterium]